MSNLLYTAIQEANAVLAREIKNAAAASAGALNECDHTTWRNNLPILENNPTCFWVADCTGCMWRCGASCTWTVPAGVSKIQFQVWGPGAGTSSAYCCGGQPYGGTGAYATTIIDAVPGCQYTICAGCTYCCKGSGTAQFSQVCMCPSYVTGHNLTNFCARGARAGMYGQMLKLHGGTCCRYQAKTRTSSGPCICSTGTYYCFDNSCATCGLIDITIDDDAKFFGTDYGLCGIYPIGCLDTNNYGYFISPPWIGLDHQCCTNSCYCFAFTSGSCQGCCYMACIGPQNIYRRFFGGGGSAMHTMGGCTSQCGDFGRAGAVVVRYC